MDDIVAKGYERWDANDFDGFLGLFPDDAVFVVPGATRVSGDHDKTTFRGVLEEVAVATMEGRHRQERVCSYSGPSGAALVFDNFVTIEGKETKYHSVHEWIFRDGSPHVWMLYVHEYDVFEQAWM